MAIILGVNIPDNKRIENALTKIQGIGPTISKNILSSAGIIDNPRVHELAEEDLARIRSSIDSLKLTLEGDLKREVRDNIRRLVDIKSYRGLRHRRGLPVNGQRTKTNARTKRGRKTAVAGNKQTPKH